MATEYLDNQSGASHLSVCSLPVCRLWAEGEVVRERGFGP